MGLFDFLENQNSQEGQESENKMNQIERAKQMIVQTYVQQDPEFEKFFEKELMSLSLGEAAKMAQFEQVGDLSYFRQFVDKTWKKFQEKKNPSKQPEPPKTEPPKPTGNDTKSQSKKGIKASEFAKLSWNDKIKVLEELVEDDIKMM